MVHLQLSIFPSRFTIEFCAVHRATQAAAFPTKAREKRLSCIFRLWFFAIATTLPLPWHVDSRTIIIFRSSFCAPAWTTLIFLERQSTIMQ
jgi:hypothetical protein